MSTVRLTMSQAVINFLQHQYVARDGAEMPFFAGVFGIFGHGNLAGIGQALQQNREVRYYQTRNEQAMVHTAAAYAKVKNRMQTFACTTSIGPGATNMLTAAAGATINRLPVLLLPGDIYSGRLVAPVLQQLESEHSQDISVNDCFKPISRYWDRINRPEQLLMALPETMRVLTSPVDTGTVTLGMPQDVQTEAFDYPVELFHKRIWQIPRNRPDMAAMQTAAQWIRESKRPVIIAGGGVIYSEATETLKAFVEQTGIPVAETQAGKGALRYDHPLNLGAMGVTGTLAANRMAQSADLVIGIGTRYDDFITASKTAFMDPDVRFVNINVAEFDAYKHNALPLVGDAKVTLEELAQILSNYRCAAIHSENAQELHDTWENEVQRIYDIRHGPLVSQGELIGAINDIGDPEAIMVCAAGSLPGDLHKLWRTRHVKQYHLEYGYSCMGYEIAGGLGVKMAAPDREVYVLVGDGSYLMLSADIVTAVQEGYKLTIILMDNSGYKSIGALSRSIGDHGFGTRFVEPADNGLQDDRHAEAKTLPIDLAANAESLGAKVLRCQSRDDFVAALKQSAEMTETTVIYIQNDRYHSVPGYDTWWEVPIAEVSESETVQAARRDWEENVIKERHYL